MTDDLLHSFLNQAENSKLPEGEYLKVCNALKKTFEDMNKSSDKYKSNDMKFILSFETDTKTKCVFSITKYLTIRGSEPNMAVYSLKISSKTSCIIDDVDKKLNSYSLSKLVDLIMESYHFDFFTLETVIGDRWYDVDDVRDEEFNLAKSSYERGPLCDDSDIPILNDRSEITFVKRILQKVINLSLEY
jgi:hypothetical protein